MDESSTRSVPCTPDRRLPQDHQHVHSYSSSFSVASERRHPTPSALSVASDPVVYFHSQNQHAPYYSTTPTATTTPVYYDEPATPSFRRHRPLALPVRMDALEDYDGRIVVITPKSATPVPTATPTTASPFPASVSPPRFRASTVYHHHNNNNNNNSKISPHRPVQDLPFRYKALPQPVPEPVPFLPELRGDTAMIVSDKPTPATLDSRQE